MIVKEEVKAEDYSTPRGNLFQFFPEAYVLAAKTEDWKLDTPDLRKLITTETANKDFCLAAAAVGQPKTMLSYNADDVLVTLFLVDGASQ